MGREEILVRGTGGRMVGMLLVVPLLASASSYLWTHLFPVDDHFPFGPRVHRLLVTAQLGVGLWVYSTWNPSPARLATAAMYLSLAGGVAYLLRARGQVPCGCLSSLAGHRVSWRLLAADVALAAVALAARGEAVPFAPAWGLALGLAIGIGTLLATTGIPDAIAAIRAYGAAADRYRPWLRGYKELLP